MQNVQSALLIYFKQNGEDNLKNIYGYSASNWLPRADFRFLSVVDKNMT